MKRTRLAPARPRSALVWPRWVRWVRANRMNLALGCVVAAVILGYFGYLGSHPQLAPDMGQP